MENQPLVSIIIPTFNSESTIKMCLESIIDQSYRNIEIIVVDKKSLDGTLSIVKSISDNIKIYQINAYERCEQLNYGSKRANGKYLYRVDSDFILDPGVVEEAVYSCEKLGFEAICVHNTSDPTISIWSKIRKFERDCYKNDDLNVAARFIRKDIFEKVGSFDEELVASEDYDLHNRILRDGYKIGKIQAEEIHLGEPKSLFEIINKHYYYGKTIKHFLYKNNKRGLMQLNPIRPAYFKNWKKFVYHPILTFGFIIYQIARYFSAGAGYIVSIII